MRGMSIESATKNDLSEGDSYDFRDLHEQGYRPGVGKSIGLGFVHSRDFLARGLLRLGVSPNHLTIFGFIMTVGASVCYFVGGSHALIGPAEGGAPTSLWPLWAAVFLFLASAGDMLDGAVARIGKIKSPVGAVLDSTVDRFSDVSVFIGLGMHFAMIGNLTYTLLAMAALSNSFLISYVKARAEDLIEDCSVGYWLRGERSAGLLIASFCGHLPAVLWLLAVSTAFTVFRRLDYTRQVLTAQASGKPAPLRGPFTDFRRYLAPWRFPRGSKPYDVVTGLLIGFIFFAPLIWPFFYGTNDLLRGALVSLGLPVGL
jgi:phosphatidylglycerophosphate synthase